MILHYSKSLQAGSAALVPNQGTRSRLGKRCGLVIWHGILVVDQEYQSRDEHEGAEGHPHELGPLHVAASLPYICPDRMPPKRFPRAMATK